MPREWMFLECGECGTRWYRTSKNKRAEGKLKIERRKFCPKCRHHTLHKEKKK